MIDRPSWTILIPTIPQRADKFRRLLDCLLPQTEGHAGRVRVLAWRNVGTPRLAEIRDTLIDDAGSDYVSFIDDDDLVPAYFADEVVAALASRPDHVGFKLEYCVDGKAEEVVEHSTRWNRWGRSSEGVLYRDLTHIDPIRRDLASRGRFARARAGRAEDRVWVKQVRPFVSPDREVYIDKVMYHYLWSHEGSSWQRPHELQPAAGPRVSITHPHFAWHPRSDA